MQGNPVEAGSPPVCVLFADMSDSAQLYAERGDAAAFEVISRCLSLLEEQVRLSGGHVVKRAGDGVLAVFDGAADAVRAGARMQQALEVSDSDLHREGVQVRVGISRGVAVREGGDVYGDVVNVASRLVALAAADEVVISDAVYAALPDDMRAAVRLIDQLVLRGRPSSENVYEYLWKGDDATLRITLPRDERAGALEVTAGDDAFLVVVAHPKLRIGRAPRNDIVIDAEFVSRFHATIILRGGLFVLIDRSTNGTYVQIEGRDLVRIIRDEAPVSGSGRIFVGSPDAPPIHFRLRQR